MKRADGGPAFPRPCSEDRKQGDQPDGNMTIDEQAGMSLRDWFAGLAPPLSLLNIREIMDWPKDLPEGNDTDDVTDTIIVRWNELSSRERARAEAIWAYQYADAMIKERNRGQ